jgi:hypothetical protein
MLFYRQNCILQLQWYHQPLLNPVPGKKDLKKKFENDLPYNHSKVDFLQLPVKQTMGLQLTGFDK